jgi:hypothetical protein
VVDVLTLFAPFAGLGLAGVPGGGGGADCVVNDQTEPGVAPAALCAVIVQKYVVFVARVPGV